MDESTKNGFSWLLCSFFTLFSLFATALVTFASINRAALYQFELPANLSMQSQSSIDAQRTFWSIVAFFGEDSFYILLVCGLVAAGSQRTVLRFIALFIFIASTLFFAKAAFREPAPYQLTSKVSAWGCRWDFAYYSGHASSFVAVVWLVIDRTLLRQQSAETSSDKRDIVGALVSFSIGLAWILIILSRIALGVHSVSQVLVGALAGLTVMTLFMLLSPLLEAMAVRWRRQSAGAETRRYATVALVTLLPSLGAYAYNRLYFSTPQLWIDNHNQSLCGKDGFIDDSNRFRFMSGVEDMKGSVLLFAFILCIAPLNRLLHAHLRYFKLNLDVFMANEKSWWRRVLMFVIVAIVAAALWLGIGECPQENDFLALFCTFLRASVLIFWLIYLAPVLCVHLRLHPLPTVQRSARRHAEKRRKTK